jgi:hypothetical protein
MLRFILSLLLALATAPALAEEPRVRTVDLAALDTHALHDGQGQVGFLALDGNGWPLVARIVFRDGDAQEPYTVDDGRIRFAFVEAAEIAFGEGSVIDHTAERTYSAGEILVIPPGASFWVAAREGSAEGATLVIAIVPGNATINVPLK